MIREIDVTNSTEKPRPNRDEIANILEQNKHINIKDMAQRGKFGVVAQRAAAQIEAIVNQRITDDINYRYKELHRITEVWEKKNGNFSLDQKE